MSGNCIGWIGSDAHADCQRIGWDAYLEMDTQTFLALAMKRLSMTGLLKKIVKKEVRIKGMRKLLILPKILSILIEN